MSSLSSSQPARRSNGVSSAPLISQPGVLGSIARFWERTYAPDYAGFALLLVAYILIQLFIVPFHRMFFIDDISIQFPHALHERVPLTWLFVYAGGIPIIIMLLVLIITKASAHKYHVTLMPFFVGMIMTSLVTDIIKNAVGRPRPDLIDRCQPKAGTPRDELVTYQVCTNVNSHTVQDGWRSFPSGHSSFAFCGLGFLAIFLCGQVHVFRPISDLGKSLLALAPLLGAAMIAISRCEDYRHDVYDVCTGSIIGITIAYYTYRRHYPRLRSRECHEPYPSRSVVFAQGFSKLRDDEENARNPMINNHESDDEL